MEQGEGHTTETELTTWWGTPGMGQPVRCHILFSTGLQSSPSPSAAGNQWACRADCLTRNRSPWAASQQLCEVCMPVNLAA